MESFKLNLNVLLKIGIVFDCLLTQEKVLGIAFRFF